MTKRSCSVPDCGRPHNARGYCFGHYERWKKLGHPDESRPLNSHVKNGASLLERLQRRIDTGLSPDECWEWRGARGGTKRATGIGYGKLTVNGRQLDAHRVSWEVHHGRPVPEGMHILHSCDNPLCVNPTHLRAGSNDDNVGDMVGRWRHTYGVRNPQAKLDDSAITDIRTSSESVRALALKYGVTEGAIYGVLARRSWKHLP